MCMNSHRDVLYKHVFNVPTWYWIPRQPRRVAASVSQILVSKCNQRFNRMRSRQCFAKFHDATPRNRVPNGHDVRFSRPGLARVQNDVYSRCYRCTNIVVTRYRKNKNKKSVPKEIVIDAQCRGNVLLNENRCPSTPARPASGPRA